MELITSDRFHANIGIFTNICNGVSILYVLDYYAVKYIGILQACRILWGLLYDRIGYRKCFIIIGVFVSLGVSSLPLLKYLSIIYRNMKQIIIFSEAVNSTEVKILWSVIMVVLYCMIPGTFAVRIILIFLS